MYSDTSLYKCIIQDKQLAVSNWYVHQGFTQGTLEPRNSNSKGKKNSWSSGGSSSQRRLNLQFAMLITQGLYRPFYGFEGMLGNQDKMVEKSKVLEYKVI